MSSKKLKFKKGELITLNGNDFKLAKPCTLDVIQKPTGNTQAQEKPEGEHQSDESQAIAKDEVLSIVQKEIDALETHENKILNGGILENEDDLFFDEEDESRIENYGVAAHATVAAHIMTLKKMLKTLSNL